MVCCIWVSCSYRPVEDLAFAVARFFQKGGTFHNYFMYFGGTNFGRTDGGPLFATSYDYDAPIYEYGFIRQPKWGHLLSTKPNSEDKVFGGKVVVFGGDFRQILSVIPKGTRSMIVNKLIGKLEDGTVFIKKGHDETELFEFKTDARI